MPSTSADRPRARRTFAICAVLFLGTIALFSRALDYDFTNFDDPTYVTGNHHVQGGLAWSGVQWAFTGRSDYWHPLTWLSHMLDWELHGDNATGHRFTSVLWHALNAVLVFGFLRRLTGAGWTSAICAALFAWHPLRVESVVWMPERKDVMSGCFFLLTLWSYVRYADKRAARAPGTGGAYALTLAMFLCALMCKPVMVALPGVLVGLDIWPLRRLPAGSVAPARDSWRFLALEKLPFLALSVVIAGVTLAMQHQVGALASLPLSFSDRAANAVVSLPRYLGKFLWPFDLAVIYPHPGSWPAVRVIASAALVLALTALAFWQWRRRPWLVVGWGWFLVMLLPGVGLVQAGLQAMADRYTYVPVIGLQLALLWTLRDAAPKPLAGWIPAGAAALVLMACGARTWDQQKVWRDPPTLFAHALAVTSDNYAAHGFQGLTALSHGRIDEAEIHTLRALAIKPDFALAHDALATLRREQGRLDEALTAQRRLIEIMPRQALSHSDLGDLLLLMNRPDEAAASFAAALRLNPQLPQPHLGLAKLARDRGDTPGAIAHYEKALALGPLIIEAHNNLAALLASAGRRDEAAVHYAAACKLAPRVPEIRVNYATLLREMGRPADAVEQARAAVTLRPEDPALQTSLALGLAQLGDTLARGGKVSEAVAQYEEAIRLRPAEAELHARLGYALMVLGRAVDAVRSWEEALRLNPGFPGLRERIAQARQQIGSGP